VHSAGYRRHHDRGSRIRGRDARRHDVFLAGGDDRRRAANAGFIGIGTIYALSRKFISADGGLARLVWTTTRIKQKLGDRLRQRCEELGKPGFYEKIADETVCTELEPLIEYLATVEHPALEMGEMV